MSRATRIKNAIFMFWWALQYAFVTLRHKWFVMHGYYKARVPYWFWRALWHDASKFSPREIFAYGFAFFGPLSKLDPKLRDGNLVVEKQDGVADTKKPFAVFVQQGDDEAIVAKFKTSDDAYDFKHFVSVWKTRWLHAWLHHQSRNKHHWEYWIPRTSVYGREDMRPIEMPERFVREMVGDWMGAGRAYQGSYNVDKWLKSAFPNIEKNLHEQTIALLRAVLDGVYDGVWVKNVFDSGEEDRAYALQRAIDDFGVDPVLWVYERYEGLSIDVELAENGDTDDFIRRVIRVQDPYALSDLAECKIVLKNRIKVVDSENSEVAIFYKIIEGAAGDSQAAQTAAKPEISPDTSEEGQTDDDEPNGEPCEDPERGPEDAGNSTEGSESESDDDGGDTDVGEGDSTDSSPEPPRR